MLSKVIIIGNLGRDADMHYTESGKAVCSFSVAAKRKSKEKEETTWFRVTIWDKLAESISSFLLKGRQVYIEGRLIPDPDTGGPVVYQKKDGSWGASYDVTAEAIRLLGSKPVDSNEPVRTPVDDSNLPF